MKRLPIASEVVVASSKLGVPKREGCKLTSASSRVNVNRRLLPSAEHPF